MPDPTPFFQAAIGLTQTRAAAVTEDIEIKPFRQWCERQPPGSNLCWAAVSRAMLGFSRGREMTFDEICAAVRSPPVTPAEPFFIHIALKHLGVSATDEQNLRDFGTQIAPDALRDRKPIAAIIVWPSSNGTALPRHVIAIFGWIPARQSLIIFDPNTVGTSDDIIKEVRISEMGNYLEGAESKTHGTWAGGYVVSRAS